MAFQETILQHWVLTKFAYPFLLMFFIVYAILEKTKAFGDGDSKHRINALVAFIIGLIFISAVYPKLVVSNLILFLTVAIIVVFVGLVLWGFVVGGEAKIESKGMKRAMGVAIVIAVIIATLWASGTGFGIFNFLFYQAWSATFWTNFLFIVVVGAALGLVLFKKKD